MFKNKISLLVFLISIRVLPFLVAQASSQYPKTDILLKTDKEDTTKINHLNAIAWELQNTLNLVVASRSLASG